MTQSTTHSPSVAVVIPTAGRPELIRALRSVGEQDYEGAIQSVVVVDKEEDPRVISRAREMANELHFAGGVGAAAARNLGIQRANCDLIAFLDDDDTWEPEKIRLQVAAVRRGHDVVSSRVRLVPADGGRVVSGVPRSLIEPNEQVAHYLFRRRRPGSQRASLYTSTILATASLCESVPWQEGLARHQDWDWLIRAQAQSASICQLGRDLVNIHVGSSGSISAKSNWAESLNWAETVIVEPATRADFLTAQTLRYALHARNVDGVREVLAGIRRTRSAPALGPMLIGLAGTLPRTQIERMMRWIR